MNRYDAIKKIRSKLANGGLSIGSWMQISHSSVAEIMGDSGYDWVAVDLEHGSISVNQLPNLFRAIELGGTLPLVRLGESQPKDCKEALDAGAGGVIVPMVSSADQLIEVRDACRWPPSGTRGVGFSRANLYGKYFDSYNFEAQSPILVAMIESQKAVESLDEILEVDGLDAILIGPYDLSASMKITAQFEHPEFESIMAKILKMASNKGVPCGVHVVEPSQNELEKRIKYGYRFLAYSIDSAMLLSVCSLPFSNKL
jgi:2-dehydro-3-deoxyglucarate aldolase